MAFSAYKRSLEEDNSSESSVPDSPMMFPALMLDVDGMKKVIFNEGEVKELNERVRLEQTQVVKSNAPKKKQRVAVVDIPNNIAAHGLSPAGMEVPVKGQAFCVGGSGVVKQPLKESNLEKFIRIQTEQDEKKKKKAKSIAKRLKKEGKVATLAPFFYS
jgi:hypothetical protein